MSLRILDQLDGITYTVDLGVFRLGRIQQRLRVIERTNDVDSVPQSHIEYMLSVIKGEAKKKKRNVVFS